jgi:hypothetical protein
MNPAAAPQDASHASPHAPQPAPWLVLGVDDDPESWLGYEAAMPPHWTLTTAGPDADTAPLHAR